MKITTDEQGFVQCFAYIGDLVDGIEIPEPEDMDLFMHQFYAFRLRDGQLVYDSDAYEAHETQEQQDAYRRRREQECFSVINRGWLWYEDLTADQKSELRTWYKAWLDGTPTQTVPEKPAWLS